MSLIVSFPTFMCIRIRITFLYRTGIENQPVPKFMWEVYNRLQHTKIFTGAGDGDSHIPITFD